MTPSLYPTLRHRFGWLPTGGSFWSLGEGEDPWGAFGEGEERPDHPDGEDRAEENQPPEDTEGSRACGELKADMLLCHHCHFFALDSASLSQGGLVYHLIGLAGFLHQGAFNLEKRPNT